MNFYKIYSACATIALVPLLFSSAVSTANINHWPNLDEVVSNTRQAMPMMLAEIETQEDVDKARQTLKELQRQLDEKEREIQKGKDGGSDKEKKAQPSPSVKMVRSSG